MHYRVHARRPGDLQYNVETFHDAESMAKGITEWAALGLVVENIDQFEPHQDPENVRYDYESGAAIQYYDADDASEHHLRMMGG